MIPYQLDPTLHTSPPPPAELGDGFAPPVEHADPSDAASQDLAGGGLDQRPSQF